MYHPDATHCQHDVSSSVRNARFRAITHAYGVLRGRNGLRSSAGAWDYRETRDEVMRAELRRRSRRSRSAPPTTTAENIDDTQLWYTLTAFGLVGVSLPFLGISKLLIDDQSTSWPDDRNPIPPFDLVYMHPHPHPLARSLI